MELDWAAAGFFWMQVYFPCLSHGIGLDKVPLVMDMKPMVSSMVLQVGYKAGNIEQGHPYRVPALTVSS